jgi:sulfur carrier protein ThiS
MRITISAYGEVRRYLLGGERERALELAEGATLADLARALEAGPDDFFVARRDDGVLREESPLRDGDRIELFAPVGGG